MTKARDIASAAPAPSTVDATELGYLDGVSSAIQTQLDAKTAKSTLSTTGDIYYASGANTPARLGIGSTGNVLTVASGIPSWAAPAGGGKVLQVVQGTLSTAQTSTSSTYVDTGLTVNITPSSASSKVLIFATINGAEKRSSDTGLGLKLLRGATVITASSGNGYEGAATRVNMGTASLNYLDSPATTSATTYKVQFASEGGANGVGVCADFSGTNATTSTIIAMEIGA